MGFSKHFIFSLVAIYVFEFCWYDFFLQNLSFLVVGQFEVKFCLNLMFWVFELVTIWVLTFVTIQVFELSWFEFLCFVTLKIFCGYFLNFGFLTILVDFGQYSVFFLVLSQFQFLSFVTIWVLTHFEFLSFVAIWFYKFCHNLNFLNFVFAFLVLDFLT